MGKKQRLRRRLAREHRIVDDAKQTLLTAKIPRDEERISHEAILEPALRQALRPLEDEKAKFLEDQLHGVGLPASEVIEMSTDQRHSFQACFTWTVRAEHLADGWHYLAIALDQDPDRQQHVVMSEKPYASETTAIDAGRKHVQRFNPRAEFIQNPREAADWMEGTARTLGSISRAFPHALYLFDGDDWIEPVTIEEMRERWLTIDGTAAWELVLDSPLMVEGSNLYVTLPNTASTWFTRIVSLGLEGPHQTTVRSILEAHAKNQVIDLNKGGRFSDRAITWFYRTPPAEGILAVDASNAKLVQSLPSILDQPARLDEHDIMLVSPRPSPLPDLYLMTILESLKPMEIPAGWRSDAPMIRWIAKEYGTQYATARQRLPLIWMHDVVAETTRDEWQEVTATVPSLDRLPWNDFVIDMGPVPGMGDKYADGMWQRITTAEEYARTQGILTPGKGWRGPPDRDDLLIVETALHVTEVDDWIFLLAALRRDQWLKSKIEIFDIRKQVELSGPIHNEAVNAITQGLFCAAYLAQTPKYLVLEKSKTSRGPMKKNPKPWTRTDLPRVILLDPTSRVRKERVNHGGTHASPIRHIRKGCVAILMHPRFYKFPHTEKIINHEPSLSDVKEIVYQQTGFISCRDSQRMPHVYINRFGEWVELEVRRVFQKESWSGSTEWETAEKVYRVVEREGKN